MKDPAADTLRVIRNSFPVLLLAYTRSDLVQRRLTEIRAAGFQRVFVHVDGAKLGDTRDALQHQLIDEILLANRINFSELNVYRQSENLGCRQGPFAGIDWFLDQETHGLILEDDISLDANAAEFLCKTVPFLDRDRILTSCAWSAPPSSSGEVLMRKSRFPQTWAWCVTAETWWTFRSWLNGIESKDQLHLSLLLLTLFLKHPSIHRLYALRNIKRTLFDHLDAWDYDFHFWHIMNGVQIKPSRQLIANEGFGYFGSHRAPVLFDTFSQPTTAAPLHITNCWVDTRTQRQLESWEARHEYPVTPKALLRYFLARYREQRNVI